MLSSNGEISVEERNKVICKICKELKIRIEAGRFPNSNNKRYINEEGKHWNGLVCAECSVNKMKENMKQLRFTRKLSSEKKEA